MKTCPSVCEKNLDHMHVCLRGDRNNMLTLRLGTHFWKYYFHCHSIFGHISPVEKKGNFRGLGIKLDKFITYFSLHTIFREKNLFLFLSRGEILCCTHKLTQVRCEVIGKNFTGCERREMSDGFRFKVLQVVCSEPQRKRGGRRLGEISLPPMKVIIVEI